MRGQREGKDGNESVDVCLPDSSRFSRLRTEVFILKFNVSLFCLSRVKHLVGSIRKGVKEEKR